MNSESKKFEQEIAQKEALERLQSFIDADDYFRGCFVSFCSTNKQGGVIVDSTPAEIREAAIETLDSQQRISVCKQAGRLVLMTQQNITFLKESVMELFRNLEISEEDLGDAKIYQINDLDEEDKSIIN